MTGPPKESAAVRRRRTSLCKHFQRPRWPNPADNNITSRTRHENERLLPGKFLRQQDVPQPANVTIASIDEMIVDAVSNESKPVVFFREFSKGMVGNKTNIRTLFELLGTESDTSEWVGRQVRLFNDPTVSYQGKRVGGLRVGPVRKSSNGLAKPSIGESENPADGVEVSTTTNCPSE